MLTAVSLFAGVGGFDLAMQRNGIQVVATVEIDKHARKVLARHFPEATHFEDVRKVSGEQLRDAGFVPERGIITGGFPCQDLSVAGRRAGLAGERSGLFWEIVRLVAEIAPRWLVLENVPGLLSSNDGRDFGVVLGALAERGYGFGYRILDAEYFGVAQRRRRVFIIGRAGDDGRTPGEILALAEGVSGHPAPSRATGQEIAADAGPGVANTLGTKRRHDLDNETYIPFVKVIRSGARDENGDLPPEVWAERDVAPTLNVMDNTGDSRATVTIARALTARHDSSPDGDRRFNVVPDGSTFRRLTPVECERLQGFEDGWTDGQPDSARYKQMGNAVCVPVVEWIMERLVSLDERAKEEA